MLVVLVLMDPSPSQEGVSWSCRAAANQDEMMAEVHQTLPSLLLWLLGDGEGLFCSMTPSVRLLIFTANKSKRLKFYYNSFIINNWVSDQQ